MPFSFKDLPRDLSEKEYKEKFEEILETDKGFNVNAQDSDSKQPLIVSAAERGFINAVKVLLSEPIIDVNARDGKRTALHMACKHGHFRLIKLLVGHCSESSGNKTFTADITLTDEEGNTPFKLLPKSTEEYNLHQLLLYFTCEIGRLDVLNELITMGVKLDHPDSSSRTPLHLACDSGHLSIVKRLLDYVDDQANKVNIEAKLGNNNTALHIANLKAYPEIIHELILRGAKVDAVNEDNQTPFMIAFEQMDKKPQELLQIIELFKKLPSEKFDIKKDITTRITKVSKNSYFHIVAANEIVPECFAKLFELIDDSSDILNYCNDKGYAPLHLAVMYNIAMIPLLKAKRANLLVKREFVIEDRNGQRIDQGDGITPLHLVFIHPYYYGALEPLLKDLTKQQIIKLIKAKTHKKQATVLHYAAECHAVKSDVANHYFEQLLNSLDETELDLISDNPVEALINSVDSEGNTPAHNAIHSVNYGNYLALMRRGAKIDIKNKEGMTAFHYVVQSGHFATLKETLPTLTKPEIIALFQMKGQKQSTLLHLAANIEDKKDIKKACEENVLALLLTYLEAVVVDKELFTRLINEQNEDGNTPAHIASMKLNIFNYIYLIEVSAKIDITNKVYQTAAYKIKAHPSFPKMPALRQQVKTFKQSLQPNVFTRIYRSVSGVDSVPLRASGSGSPRGGRPRSDSKTNIKPPAKRSSNGGSPRDITLMVPASSPSSSTPPSSSRPLLEQEPGSARSATPSSMPPSARSTEEEKKSDQQQINALLYNLVDKDKTQSTWITLKQHFIKNLKTYIVIGLVAYYAGFFALCALCVFFPPAAGAIPIVALIGKALGAMHFLHIAAPLINPIAKAITMVLPIIVPQAITLIKYSIGTIATGVYGFGKGCQWLLTKFTEPKNNSQIAYKSAAELGIVVSTGKANSAGTHSVTERSGMQAETQPELESATSSNSGCYGWIKSLDNCFKPFRDFGSLLFGYTEADEPAPLKRKTEEENISPSSVLDKSHMKPAAK